MAKLALKHSTLNRPDIHRPIITYTDVDGDTITISTHRELKEAFEQFVTHPSNTGLTPIVLRAQASFVKKQKDGSNNGMQRWSEAKLESLSFSKVNAETAKKGRKGAKWMQLQLVLDKLVTNMTDAVESLSKDVDDMRFRKTVQVPIAKVVTSKEKDELESTNVAKKQEIDKLENNSVTSENTCTSPLENDVSDGGAVISNIVVAKPDGGSWEVVS